MPHAASPAVTETTEEGRALLQSRVALFWKVIFFISVLSTALGVLGAIMKPSGETLVLVAQCAQAGTIWWLCSRGRRSVGFLRLMEAGGLFVNISASALLGRYAVVGFIAEHSLGTDEGILLADAYITMLHIAGIGLTVAIRAALVPSSPRRTVIVSAMLGVPLVASDFFVLTADRQIVFRELSSNAYPWVPSTAAMLWGFVVITSTVISWVIWGLRAEVREAQRMGQYVLEKKIGEGGMGEVYRARHGMMRRPSALKLVRSDSVSVSNLARFEREVQLTARLTHPNTITIFDYGRTHDGVFYYAMELLDGATLQRIVDVDGPQPPERVARILTMACGALAEAHSIGLIHRDIKPANMMLCLQGGDWDVLKLLDFGLVKEVATEGDVALTGTGLIVGTPQYMAPESILDAEAADARTDIYALGAVAYFLLAGTEVFSGQSVVEICGKHIHEKAAPLSERGVSIPTQLEELVLACLEKEPARRPQSATELRRRLEACGLDPWNSERAQTWWREHRGQLDVTGTKAASGPRTIAIDRSRDAA